MASTQTPGLAQRLSEYASEFGINASSTLATLVGCHERTAYKWLTDEGTTPHGDHLIKVRYILEALGFTLEELRIMPATIRDFGRMVVLTDTSFVEAAQSIGYPSSNGSKQLQVVLLQKSGPRQVTSKKAALMEQLIVKNADEIEAGKLRILTAHGRQPPPSLALVPAPIQVEPEAGTSVATERPESVADALEHARHLLNELNETITYLSTLPDGLRLLHLVAEPELDAFKQYIS